MESPEPEQPLFDQQQMEGLIARLRRQQNLIVAVLFGTGAAILSGLLWAVITVTTEFQIGWMAIGVGVAVGFAVRMGKGIDKIFGILGGVLALAGCLLGNIFTIFGFAGKNEGISPFALIPAADYSAIPEIMMASFSPIDLLFYGLAIFQGYKLSFRSITNDDIAALQ